MSENDFKKIKKIASEHTLSPKADVWNRIDNKLKSKRSKNRILFYRNVSVAAIFLSVVSVTLLMKVYINNHDPEIFTSSERYRPIILEELIEDSPEFYTTENIKELKEAYINTSFLY